MEKKLLLIMNPCAGQKRAKKFLADIVGLYNSRGYDCVTYVTAGVGDATRYLREHNVSGVYERIVCVGGDGTLNETVCGLAASGAYCPVGYIPAGSTNDYANSLGLSSDIMQAAQDAVEGVSFQLDLGSFEGRNFIYTASCGAFAKASYSTPQAAKNLLGHMAYIFEGLRDIPNIKPIHIVIETESENIEGDYLFCGITNTISIGGILKLDKERVRLNDGLFEVMLIKNPANPVQMTKLLMSLYNQEMPSEMIDFFTASRMKIVTDREIEWTLDGEKGEIGCEFEAVNIPRRIELILPKRALESVPAELPPANEKDEDDEDQLPD